MSDRPGNAAGIAHLPRMGIAWQLVRARVRLRRGRLDVALGAGADPWSSADLLVRAAQLGSTGQRRKIADALDALIALAEFGEHPSAYHRPVRCRPVLAHREVVHSLAERLRDPAPVDVTVVACVAWLVWNGNSPAFVGGVPADELTRTASACARAIAEERLRRH
jgi:hypothetical protein